MLRALLAGFLLSFAAVPIHAACSAVFQTPDFYPTGLMNTQLALVNFNGDDLPDALIGGGSVAAAIPDSLVVLPALESGGFGPPARLLDRQTKGPFAAADFDRDGYDDVVVVDDDPNAGKRLLYFRNRRGTLDAPVAHPLITHGEPVVGDFNGDGRPDVTVLTGQNVTMLRGDGAGSFTAQTYPAGDGRYLKYGAAGDFDRDGFDDLVATAADQSAVIFFGAGSGVFREMRVRPYAGLLRKPALLDYDRDGRLDAVFAFETTSNRVRILRDLAGEAEIDLLLLHDTIPYPAAGLAAADFNDDGADTIVAATRDGGILADGRHYLSLGPNVEGVVALGDPNRDGRLDVLTATDENLVVVRNAGDGTFLSPVDIGQVYASADFNGDGLLDLLSTTVRLQNPDGSFRTAQELRFTVGSPGIQPLIGDVNRDGHLDFVHLTKSGSYLGLMSGTGRGDGTFAIDESAIQASLEEGKAWLADLNGDGYLDVLGRISPSSSSEFLAIAPGRADGRFDPWLQFHSSAIGFPADFDADGDTDILGHRSVWFNDGHGGFTEKARSVDADFSADAVDDFDEDGFPDLVHIETVLIGDRYERRLVIARGDGTGEFSRGSLIELPVSNLHGRVQVGDFNGDRHRDVLVTSRESTTTQQSLVAFGNGAGGFLRQVPFVKWYDQHYLRPVSVVDFNRDGRDDIIDGRFVRLSTCSEPQPKRRAVRR